MPRQPLELYWQHKIADLMANAEMANKPAAIANALSEQNIIDRNGTNAGPQKRTIIKYMRKIRNGELALYEQRHYFLWPENLGPGKNQVPETHSLFALECIGYYKKEFNVTPMIGLVKRFALVSSSVRQDEKKYDLEKRAIVAEQLWYADLVGSIPNRERPDTTGISLELAGSVVNDKSTTFSATQAFAIPIKDWKFFEYMPCFDSFLNAPRNKRDVEMAKEIRDAQQGVRKAERNRLKQQTTTAWLGEDDFTWYTDTILKKFPDLAREQGQLLIFRPRPKESK